MRRHDDDGQPRLRRVQALDKLESAPSGQPEIREHHVATLTVGEHKPLLGGAGADHAPALAFEDMAEFARERGIVFDQQYGGSSHAKL